MWLRKGYFDGVGLKTNQPPADGADALIGAGGAQMGVTYQLLAAYSSSNPLPYARWLLSFSTIFQVL